MLHNLVIGYNSDIDQWKRGAIPEKKDDETLLPRLPVIIHGLITMRGWLEDRSFLLK